MEEEFYAVIKLTTGEELIAQVSYLPEESSLILQDPMIVEPMVQKKGRQHIEGFVLKDWIYASYDDCFIINMNRVITISELDTTIREFYINTIEKKHIESQGPIQAKQQLDFGTYGGKEYEGPRQFLGDLSEKGYLGSVKATKQLLEEIYKKS